MQRTQRQVGQRRALRELRIIYVILLKLVLLNVTKTVGNFNSPHIFAISSLDINHEVMSFKHSSFFPSQSGENNGRGCFWRYLPRNFQVQATLNHGSGESIVHHAVVRSTLEADDVEMLESEAGVLKHPNWAAIAES